MKKMKFRDYFVLFLVLSLSVSLLFFNSWSEGMVCFENVSKLVNKQIIYQSTTLGITLLFLVILWQFKRDAFTSHFRKGNISAAITPVPWVGIKGHTKENWLHIGRNFTISITLVTAIVIYFQVVKGNGFDAARFIRMLPLAILFSIVNSFVEESITRLGVVVVFKGILADKYIMLISGALFGILHYWGTPGGIMGVLVAGFLGWFLAKSILETKGIFWAWMIHCLQDVVIFSSMFMLE